MKTNIQQTIKQIEDGLAHLRHAVVGPVTIKLPQGRSVEFHPDGAVAVHHERCGMTSVAYSDHGVIVDIKRKGESVALHTAVFEAHEVCQQPPTCSYCMSKAELTDGHDIYPKRKDLAHKKFWICRGCDAYVGCHPQGAHVPGQGVSDGTIPLGRLADAELRRAKAAVHDVFDQIWRDRKAMGRRAAYAWLADALHIPPEHCHIGMFDLAMCNKALKACEEKLDGL